MLDGDSDLIDSQPLDTCNASLLETLGVSVFREEEKNPFSETRDKPPEGCHTRSPYGHTIHKYITL